MNVPGTGGSRPVARCIGFLRRFASVSLTADFDQAFAGDAVAAVRIRLGRWSSVTIRSGEAWCSLNQTCGGHKHLRNPSGSPNRRPIPSKVVADAIVLNLPKQAVVLVECENI